MPPPHHDPARLLTFLKDRDAPCARCGYNLRNLTSSSCPECGLPIAVPSWFETELPSEPQRLAAFLRDHDLICKKCRYNLRGVNGNVCPECGTTYALQHPPILPPSPPPAPGKTRLAIAAFILLAILTPVVVALMCILLLNP